jgi:RNA polymerase sigma-70 factor (ECF subfamily)
LAAKRVNYARSPEPLLVGLARRNDRQAFEELVMRRQAWIRNLMQRFCGDPALADDLAQQAFLQAWRNIPRLQRGDRFAAWLKRIAVNTWLQHLRRADPLRNADDAELVGGSAGDPAAVAMDLDRALATLEDNARLCIVLAYHERMTHEEIARTTGLPLGTVKSHIRRGTVRLQKALSAYLGDADLEEPG